MITERPFALKSDEQTRIISRTLSPENETIEKILDHLHSDRVNLATLFVLVQYQAYRGQVGFSEARQILITRFQRNNTVTGTCWSPPTRPQILGKMRERKAIEFIDFHRQLATETGIDIFSIAAYADPHVLIYQGHTNFLPIAGTQIKLHDYEWTGLVLLSHNNHQNTSLVLDSLPATIQREINTELFPPDNLSKLPF